MQRRRFLANLPVMLGVPALVHGMGFRSHTRVLPQSLLDGLLADDRVLVLVQLNGGNDGLNMVVPLDQYSLYQTLRSNIAIPESRALRLSPDVGLHPAMTGLKGLYDSGRLSVIHGVSYPNPNLSHFRATDIWMSASNSNQVLTSGWTGRFLDQVYPGYPEGYPTIDMPDPPAIQIGAVMSLVLQGPASAMGIAIQDPQTFYQLVNGSPGGGIDTPPPTPAGKELSYIRQVQVESQQFAAQIKAAADKTTNKETYPTPNTLADQLKIVARLIAGGLRTRIYLVSLGGFDTHAGQVDAADPTSGDHATLLRTLSAALTAFYSDLQKLGVENRTVTMTFSEFGRRAKSNSSLGTDHGTAAPMFVLGPSLASPQHGQNPDLAALVNDNLPTQFDFRQIYAAILRLWFGVSAEQARSVLGSEFSAVPLFSGSTTDLADVDPEPAFSLSAPWPNPTSGRIQIPLVIDTGGTVTYRVMDLVGRELHSGQWTSLRPGTTEVSLDLTPFHRGVYTLFVEHQGRSRTVRLIRQ